MTLRAILPKQRQTIRRIAAQRFRRFVFLNHRPPIRAELFRLPRGGRDRGPNLRGHRIGLPPRRGERALPIVARDRVEERAGLVRAGVRDPGCGSAVG